MATHDFFLILLLILVTARVFAELGLESGILSDQIYASLVMVVAFSTLLPPFILKSLYRRHGKTLLATT